MTDNWLEKYRPRNIADYWQSDDPGLNAINVVLKSGELPQLLILLGELGCGKTSLARTIARRFLCVNPETSIGNPCGKCEGCKELNDAWCGTIATDGYIEYDASALSAGHILNSAREHILQSLDPASRPSFPTLGCLH